MAGMSSMGATASAGTQAAGLSMLPGFFERIGLGFINRLPNEVAQPLLIILLAMSLISTFIAYRSHRRPHALVLTLLSAVAMYLGVYVRMSDALYLASLAGLIAAGAVGLYLTRERNVSYSHA